MKTKEYVGGFLLRGKNITGQKFGILTVLGIAEAHENPKGQKSSTYWNCICECGDPYVAHRARLFDGSVKSCGCKRMAGVIKAHTTHGHAPRGRQTKFYVLHRNLVDRCTNPKSESYKYYGGRGITVYEPWLIFSNFLKDVGPLYVPGLTIDRIDNSRNYEPGNIRFTTKTVQANNTRANHVVKFQGIEDTIANHCRRLGIPKTLVYCRISQGGWSYDRAFLTPVIKPTRKRG